MSRPNLTVGELIEYLKTIPSETKVRVLEEFSHDWSSITRFTEVFKYSDGNFGGIERFNDFLDFGAQ